MPLTGPHTYVGFGFGAIQAGLLAYEAFRSGSYRRLVIAEVVPDAVEALRRAGGTYAVNIAHADRVEQARVGPIEIYNPAVSDDRERLIDAIAEAEAVGTAVPSVSFYASEGPGSLHRVLAEGLHRKAFRTGPLAVVYTAENHNHAAEILEEKVREALPDAEREAALARVRILNTVIGKMSGIVPDEATARAWELEAVTPGSPRAFLVESFNRILVTRIVWERPSGRDPRNRGPQPVPTREKPFSRGIAVFEEKDDLLPFEEAKLYGHNATHALGAYLGALSGVKRMDELRHAPGMMEVLRAAFVEESGEALIRKHRGFDPLFTREGYASYVDDLLVRMTNPFLRDTIERVARDPRRKLGWDDRLVGTMRLALKQGLTPRRYALGAAAAAAALRPDLLAPGAALGLEALLDPIWRESSPGQKESEDILSLIEDARRRLLHWRSNAYADMTTLAS